MKEYDLRPRITHWFTVYRDEWQRGGNFAPHAYLFDRTTKKMCCMGFYALSRGCTVREIAGKSQLGQVVNDRETAGAAVPEDLCFVNAMTVYMVNDDKSIPDHVRENILQTLLRENGIYVEFRNTRPKAEDIESVHDVQTAEV